MELIVNSSMIPRAKSLCTNEDNLIVSSFECIDLMTFLNKSDFESLWSLLTNDSLFSHGFSSLSSSSTSSSSDSSHKFVPSLFVQIIWSIVFGLMILVAMIGNITVIWIVTGHRKMRTVTNVFLLNLTIADLIMATFNGVFNFVYMLHAHWPFGETYCKINNFIASVTVASSVFTITATSIDRYIAVVHPLKPRMTKRRVMFIIILVWSLASLLSLPNLLYSSTTSSEEGGLRTVCVMIWPDGYAGHSSLDYLYNLTFLMITYVIPMISLVITYSLMSRVLWGSKGIGEETDIQRESIRSKQKVARMLMALVVLFAICWLPYHAYFLYTYHYPHVNQSIYIQHIYLFSYWLAMSNSMYNPLIYYWMNKRFRGYFASIFCFLARNRLKKQLSYNNKTDMSSNGFAGTHYRRATVQSNHIELHRRNSNLRFDESSKKRFNSNNNNNNNNNSNNKNNNNSNNNHNNNNNRNSGIHHNHHYTYNNDKNGLTNGFVNDLEALTVKEKLTNDHDNPVDIGANSDFNNLLL